MNRLSILAMALVATAHGDGNVTAEARRIASDDPDRAEVLRRLRDAPIGQSSILMSKEMFDEAALFLEPPPLPYRPRLAPSAGGARLFEGPSIDPKAKKAKRKVNIMDLPKITNEVYAWYATAGGESGDYSNTEADAAIRAVIEKYRVSDTRTRR